MGAKGGWGVWVCVDNWIMESLECSGHMEQTTALFIMRSLMRKLLSQYLLHLS